MFGAMMKQEIGWFDRKENGVGALCSRLSSQASSIQGVSRYLKRQGLKAFQNCFFVGVGALFGIGYELNRNFSDICCVSVLFPLGSCSGDSFFRTISVGEHIL